MARKPGGRGTPRYDPRGIWATGVAPLVAGAREGAARANRIASRERARARRQRQWWRQRWLLVTAAGVAVAGAVGGGYAAVTNRHARRQAGAVPETGAEADRRPAGGAATNPLTSTVEAGWEKVAGAARTVRHRVRHPGSDGPDGSDKSEPARAAPTSTGT